MAKKSFDGILSLLAHFDSIFGFLKLSKKAESSRKWKHFQNYCKFSMLNILFLVISTICVETEDLAMRLYGVCALILLISEFYKIYIHVKHRDDFIEILMWCRSTYTTKFLLPEAKSLIKSYQKTAVRSYYIVKYGFILNVICLLPSYVNVFYSFFGRYKPPYPFYLPIKHHKTIDSLKVYLVTLYLQFTGVNSATMSVIMSSAIYIVIAYHLYMYLGLICQYVEVIGKKINESTNKTKVSVEFYLKEVVIMNCKTNRKKNLRIIDYC